MKATFVVLAVALLLSPVVAAAHGGHAHVSGTVQGVTAASLTVKTASGTTTLPITSATRYYRGTGTKHPATADDVKDGMRVVVHEDAQGRAAEIHIPLTK